MEEQQKEVDKNEFRVIIRNQVVQIVVSFSFALSFHLTTKEDREEVKECSRELVYFLDYFIAYLFFVTTRHMLILFLLFCVKRP